ncbi:caspase-8 [Ischnura elegans]|uniref:caspase-8 n=1 Tax=Ischnura elegans TaxID=197161 RepID=UPI001ED8B003|nr:caspase-8 [Ischnura elegans]
MDPDEDPFVDIKNLSFDALPSLESCRSVTEKIPITVAVIRNLEIDMDIYEKVSLVFLLYPNVDLALQRLLAVEANLMSNQSSVSEISLLSDWAFATQGSCKKSMSEDASSLSPENQEAFIEALCIVQDFRSLSRINRGDRSTGLVVREMSLQTPEKYFINHTRNVLYRICESLTPPTALNLVKQVERERVDLVRPFSPDPRLLEIVFLYWASHHFIDIDDNVYVDFRNLSRHLLMLGEIGLSKMLHTMCPYIARPTKATELHKGVIVETSSLNSKSDESASSMLHREKLVSSLSIAADDNSSNVAVSKKSGNLKKNGSHSKTVKNSAAKKSASERMERYKIDVKNMGICLIINQKNFYRDSNPRLKGYLPPKPLEDRLGTDVDRDRLIEAFTSLGFEIKVMRNLTHTQLIAAARHAAISEVKQKHSCFTLCILTHGQKDVVYGCNSIPVSIMELVEIFCGSKCPALIDKPKIFIFQACQGTKLQQAPLDEGEVATDGAGRSVSGVKDYVKFLSTVPGYVSLRHKVTGSWFIEQLYEEIMCREPNSSLIDVFTLVNASLDKKSSVLDNSLISMMSELHSTLRGPVMLPWDPDAMKKAKLLSAQRILFDKLFEEYFASPKKCREVLKKICKP